MAILSRGTNFDTGDQVTAANLNALVDSATFAAGAVDNITTVLDGNSPQKIIVKDLGITTAKLATSSSTTTGVTFEKMQHVPANTVLVNDTNAEGDISAKAVADTQILIGDGTGFTAAALSGDATMTNAGVVDISDDVALGGNPTTTTQSAGNNTTRIATTAFVTTAVAAVAVKQAIIKSDSGGARDGADLYFKNMSEVSDPDSIVSFSAGNITFASTGTYLIDISGNFTDSDSGTGDFYKIHLTSSTSSTTNLLDGDGHNTNYVATTSTHSFSQKYIRTVSDVSTDKLAIYAAKTGGLDGLTAWNAHDVYVVIRKLT
tara:strand:- start:379 stop:1332 length:954 start_codon:yes stop_codon:yes gene_type:complete